VKERCFSGADLRPWSVQGTEPRRAVSTLIVELCSGLKFAAISWMLLSASLSIGQDGLGLFHKMQTAIGGADRIASIRDFEECVHADSWDDDGKPHGTVFKRVRFVRPRYLRIDQVGPGDSYVLYFDGSAGWEILPGKPLVDLAGRELRFAQGYAEGMNLNTWLADRDPENLFTSPASNVIAISTKDDASHEVNITLGPDFLPVEERQVSLADTNHPVSSQTLQFDHWEPADGVMFPRHRSNLHFDKKVAEIFTDKIKLNRDIKLSELTLHPADSAPVTCPH